IISRKLDIEFYIRSRVDTLNEEIIGKLKEAGCKRIQLGVESGSPRILKLMNKGIIIDQIKYTAGLVKKYNIPLYADFMLGYPTETKEEIEQSIRFAIDIDPDYAQFGVTMLFPKTKIYENALKSGFLKEDFWRKVTLHPDPDITYPIASERYSKEELEKMQYKAHLRFYFRPAFLIKKLYKIKNLKELKRQAQAGLKLLLKG
ncbi:MAG: radical SAM protein, partial [Thermodesulfobacteriota bacterium]|nr:radical SAM protein [Thermodesulfobacteriota bacterium]